MKLKKWHWNVLIVLIVLASMALVRLLGLDIFPTR